MIDPGCTDLNLHFEILQGQAAEFILLNIFKSFKNFLKRFMEQKFGQKLK